MLTLEECVDFSGLSDEEVQEIAGHEGLPEVLAAALGHSLLKSPEGIRILHTYFLDNLGTAASKGDLPKVRQLVRLMGRFKGSAA